MANAGIRRTGWPVVVHSLRTAIAALVSLLVARLFRLPATYRAPITTLVITQSSLGAALKVSWQRFAGTVPGAILGGMVASFPGSPTVLFGVCVFLLGLRGAVTRFDQSAYRFGGVTLAIVLLTPRTGPGWLVAFVCRGVHRDRSCALPTGHMAGPGTWLKARAGQGRTKTAFPWTVPSLTWV